MRLQYGTEQCGSGGDWRNQPSRFPRWKRREGEPEREVAVSLDGGYVRDRNRRPERNFEVVVGKVSSGDSAIRFAFVRKGTYLASQRVQKVLDASTYTDGVKITMLSDGDAGLRAIQQEWSRRQSTSSIDSIWPCIFGMSFRGCLRRLLQQFNVFGVRETGE
jgi:hypothetical protein